MDNANVLITLVETNDDLFDALLLKYIFDSENYERIFGILHPIFTEVNINCQKSNFLIAKRDDKTIGYAAGSKVSHLNNTYWSEGIYVIPEFRNKGIGHKLLQAQIELAKNSGFAYLKSNVEKTNISSKHVLEKLDFKFESRGSFYNVVLSLQEDI